MMKEISKLDVGHFADERGLISYVNQLDDFEVKRFYIIENHKNEFIRAWHGHKDEKKIFFPLAGTFMLGVVKIDDYLKPSKLQKPTKFVLSSIAPIAISVPGGYANGLMNLSQNSRILVLSSSTLNESKLDDYRYPFDYWNIWKIENR